MVHQMMPGTEEQLQKEMTTAYLGIDPTADSLHIGHLVGVMMLKHLQRAGHKPIALIGGATGMIGDPSMKSQERKLLDEPTLRHNQEAIKAQLAKFLDFDSDAPNAAEMVNNYDWMREFSFLDFIRDVACSSAAPTSGATSPPAPSSSAAPRAARHLPSPAPSSPRPTAANSARPRAATYGSTRATPRPTSSTSSGSTSATRTPSVTSASSRC